jgi:hypothetical protein
LPVDRADFSLIEIIGYQYHHSKKRKRAKWVTCGGTEHLRNEARDPALGNVLESKTLMCRDAPQKLFVLLIVDIGLVLKIE